MYLFYLGFISHSSPVGDLEILCIGPPRHFSV